MIRNGTDERSFLHALTAQMPECSPESKYFFTLLLYLYGVDQPFSGSQKELAKQFRVRGEVISGAFNELMDLGHLKCVEEKKGAGRPKRVYKIHFDESSTGRLPKKRKRVARVNLPQLQLCNVPLIEAVLLGDKDERAKDVRPELSFSNRLLLAVLLCCADGRGVVGGVGVGGLASLTGMGQDRVKNQLQRLEDLTYLRPRVPGASSVGLFGVSAGFFFINLKHAGFGKALRRGVTLIRSVHSLPVSMPSRAESILQLVDMVRRRSSGQISRSMQLALMELFCGEEFVELAPHFFGLLQMRPKAARSLLQGKLNHYASSILNASGQLSSRGYPVASSALEEIIRSDLLYFKGSLSEADVAKQQSLVQFFYRIAFSMACGIFQEMNKVPEVPFSEMEHVILLCEDANSDPRIVVESYYGVEQPYAHLMVQGVILQSYEEPTYSTPKDESELTELDRISYGLRRRPF